MSFRPGGDEQTRDRAWRDSRGLGSSRTRTVAFGASIGAHVLGILLYTAVSSVLEPEAFTLPVTNERSSEQGTPLIQLIDILPEEIDRPDEPDELAEMRAGAADARRPRFEGVQPGELLPPPASAAERLRPNLVDARIWAAPPPEFFELSLADREELILSQRIVEWYDSVAIARAAEDRLTDWTITDSNGGRWGVADGRIYLGDFALPLPINFGTPVGHRDIEARRVWEFEEIERQSQRYLIEQSWKERAAAIRARRDRERAAARGDTLRIR